MRTVAILESYDLTECVDLLEKCDDRVPGMRGTHRLTAAAARLETPPVVAEQGRHGAAHRGHVARRNQHAAVTNRVA